MADAGGAGRGIGTRRERNIQSAGKRSERFRLRRPVEIAERPGEPVEVMFGAVVILGDG
jgi:hypothetical protein